ncbi:MAG: UxaA family hydrolase [Pirellulales bacterium]
MFAVRLSPLDNIVVLSRSVEAGVAVHVDGQTLTVAKPLGLGHKLAFRPILAGEKVFKYGVPIGSATADIAPGEHVHLHNMKSDYLPTYTLDDGRLFTAHRTGEESR